MTVTFNYTENSQIQIRKTDTKIKIKKSVRCTTRANLFLAITSCQSQDSQNRMSGTPSLNISLQPLKKISSDSRGYVKCPSQKYTVYLKKNVILKFRYFGTFNDSIINEIRSAIVNMKATQMAIILAFIAL